MAKIFASRTLNPLHFEDLEPHRFEDLIRQLAYNYRPWKNLEATGRLGKDDGLDIRGIELVKYQNNLSDEIIEADDELAESIAWEREWRIQCKRYKKLTPKQIREFVSETVPDKSEPPYGLILAVACDVSAQTLTAFHEERIKLQIREGHLWTKAHLEDLLFQPENDQLLFAYFGISIASKQRSRLNQVRSNLIIKRKILRAFEVKNDVNLESETVLIRDIEDTHYPFKTKLKNFDKLIVPPWFLGTIIQPYSKGICICKSNFAGWVKPDGTWDFFRELRSDDARMQGQNNDNYEANIEQLEKQKPFQEFYEEFVPLEERMVIRQVLLLPYESILEVDNTGDFIFQGVHLFCRYSYDGYFTPFDKDKGFFVAGFGYEKKDLNFSKHKPLFEELFNKLRKAKDKV